MLGGNYLMTPRTRALALVLWGIGLFTVAGCGPGEQVRSEPPTSEAQEPAIPVYRLRVGDEIELRFLTDESLTTVTPITPGGTITLPVAGDLAAVGKTVGELAQDVEDRMAAYLLDPTVSLVITRLADQPVFVIGEVTRPGRIDSVSDLTVSRAIASAGGLLSTAKAGSVMIVRTVGVEKPEAYKVDLGEVLAGRDLSQDLALVPNDVVYVPKSAIGKVDEFVKLFFEEIIPAELFLLHGYDVLHAEERSWWQ